MDYARNVRSFFSESNRSMMGGWTLEGRLEAEKEAASKKGAEREAAERAIAERIRREKAEGKPSA
jgi:hypothetical protein